MFLYGFRYSDIHIFSLQIFRIKDSGFRIKDSGFRIKDSGSRYSGSRCSESGYSGPQLFKNIIEILRQGCFRFDIGS